MRNPWEMSNEEIFADLRRLETHVRAMILLIENVETSKDPEVIAVFIEAMQECDNNMCTIFKEPFRNIREAIRSGDGTFKKIQQKCISLGLV